MSIRVALANDFEIVVHGLRRMLEGFDDIEVVDMAVGEEPHGAPADVVLLDTYGLADGGLDKLAHLAEGAHPTAVAVLSFHTQRALVEAALARGARSYLSKGLTAAQVADAIRRTARGERVVAVPAATLGDRGWPGRSRGLTARESELLALLGHGATNKAIARATGVSENTVKTHLRRIFAKLGFVNRAQAAAFVHGDPEFAPVTLAFAVAPAS